MEYAKLQGAFLRGAAFKDADMAARGAWATLAGHCADQENGGRIVACAAWNDRQWLSRTDCMRADVDHAVASELARWEGDDLVLLGYDAVSEQAFQNLVAANRQRARDGWEKRRAADAAAAANGAAGNGKPSRRQDGSMPPVVPPAPVQDAAGIENGCHLPTDLPTDRRNTDPPAAVAAPAPPSGGAPSATATTSASEGENGKLRVRLGRYGMAASAQATAEWAGLLRERAAIVRWTEVDAFLAHCASTGRARNKPVRFARDALAIADEWRGGVRPAEAP